MSGTGSHVFRLPFECPHCRGVRWHHTRTLECGGTLRNPHEVVEMEAVDPEGPDSPPNTPDLRTGNGSELAADSGWSW